MIIQAKHNFFIYNFLKLYTRYAMYRSFHKVCISGTYKEENRPVLLISNHVSWWDGFWAMYLNLKIFRRKFHFMMLEEQLKKYCLFKKSGGYSVRKKSKSILETIHYSAEILSDNNNILLLFPQGQINSVHKRYLQFERGIERILRSIPNKVQVVFCVNITEYFSTPKPTLYMYFREYEEEDTETLKIEQAYHAFFKECIAEHENKTATA